VQLADVDLFPLLLDECDLLNDLPTRQKALSLLPGWATFYNNKTYLVRYWYLKRCILLYLQAVARRLIDVQNDRDKVSLHQVFTATSTMINEVNRELDRIDRRGRVAPISIVNTTSNLPDTLQEAINGINLGWLDEPAIFVE
jgi:hypothetical protein